jgi:hypothetical protein
MAYPFADMAQTAAQMLLERMGGLKSKPRTVMLTPELVVRRSCGANPGYQMLLQSTHDDVLPSALSGVQPQS